MSGSPPEAPLTRRALVLAAAVLGAWMTSSCKDAAKASGTSVYVSVNFTSDLVLTQIRFSAKTDHALFDPVLRPPDDSGSALPTGQTLRILMPDSLAGQTVTVAAEGLYQGRVVNQDQSDVRIKKDYEVEISLTLPNASPQPSCGPCVGCCSGVTCVTSYSLMSCGNDLICTACSPTVADNCSTGDCRCGERPACSASLGSDRCVLGQCHCGTGDPCQPGQVCSNGECQCTATSCPNGCCANNLCVPRSAGGDSVCGTASKACEACAPGQTCTGGACSDCPANCPSGCCSGGTCYPPGQVNCGIGGSACVFCDPITSDSCNAQGFCACGAGLACAPGQHCQNGACSCDAASCPNGCCGNNFCETPAANPDGGTASSSSLCGKAGRACAACDPVRADTCTSSGVCACGAGPSCDLGQKCANGTCVCDPANCAGCCSSDGLSCRSGNLDTECGRGGFNCQACPTGQSCTDGRCSDCNPSTCGGCCLGSSCRQPTPGPCPTDGSPCICGANAASCHSCATTVTDTCNANGMCGCGANGPCTPGQRCIGGRCFCDAVSCPTGCCANGQCTQPSASQCGTAGSSCFACSAVLANNCGSDGSCRCGSGPACVSGQRCLSSGCVCDAVSCRSGCCNANAQCLTPGLNNCGAMGSSCVSCDPIRADQCRSGNCACGTGGICAEGQRCVSGTCHCDGTSCASGCCTASNSCINPPTTANCGTGGARCVACGIGSDRCTAGACRCGTSSPCGGLFAQCTPSGCQ